MFWKDVQIAGRRQGHDNLRGWLSNGRRIMPDSVPVSRRGSEITHGNQEEICEAHAGIRRSSEHWDAKE
jgi:hypothetical protein